MRFVASVFLLEICGANDGRLALTIFLPTEERPLPQHGASSATGNRKEDTYPKAGLILRQQLLPNAVKQMVAWSTRNANEKVALWGDLSY